MHTLKYAFKTLFRDKGLIFWTFAFPLILGSFFKLAFSNIENDEKLKAFDVAVVNNEILNNNEFYKKALDSLSNGDDKLFNINYTNIIEAKSLLENKKITGYVVFDNESKVIVNSSGINETVLKYAIDEIINNELIVKNIINQKINEVMINNQELLLNENDLIQNIYNEAIGMLSVENNIKDTSSNNLSYTMIEFYSLIAMTCMYGGILSLTSLNKVLPNMSNVGKRVAVSKTPKNKLIFSNMLGSYLIQIVGVGLLYLFSIYVLKVNFGSKLPLIIILSLVGSLAGLSLGVFTGTIFKTSESIKSGIIIAVTMLGCFLSGMMGITMKYIIDKNISIINKLNPVSMITDGLYSLYYYNTNSRFWFNIISLIIFSIVLITISLISLRRQKYDSI